MGPSDIERVARNEMAQRGFVTIGHLVVYFNYQFNPNVIKTVLETICNYQQDPNNADKFIDPNNLSGNMGFTAIQYQGTTYSGGSSGLSTYDQAEEPKKKVKKETKKKVTLDSVIIPTDKKEQIRAAISQVKNEEIIFQEWGFDEVFEKGTAVSMLFWGIPGTGKTLMAQAIADDTEQQLKIYGNAEIQTSEPGGAERTIKQIFAEAKRAHKSGKGIVILFDECDSLLMDRNEVGPVLGALVNTLLQEIETYEGIIIFTTNRMGKLDPALERRITAKIEFEFPDKDARKKIWLRLLPKKAPISKDVDFSKLADYPLAGGNIKNAVLNAARTAAYEKSKQIHMKHFVSAIERESKALQAFVGEYEKTAHSSYAGYARTVTGVSQDMKQEIKPMPMTNLGGFTDGKN